MRTCLAAIESSVAGTDHQGGAWEEDFDAVVIRAGKELDCIGGAEGLRREIADGVDDVVGVVSTGLDVEAFDAGASILFKRFRAGWVEPDVEGGHAVVVGLAEDVEGPVAVEIGDLRLVIIVAFGDAFLAEIAVAVAEK